MDKNKIPFEYLRAFYYAVKHGALKKASVFMGLSLSAVSSHIILLEKLLSLNLMVRNKGGIRLTPDGKRLFYLIKDGIESLESIPDIYTQNLDEGGEIVLNTWTGVASHLIAHQLKDFYDKYNNIKIRIKCHNSNSPFEEWVGDVAIAPYVPHRPDLRQIKILSQYMHLYASKEYIKQFGEPQTWEDLDNHRLISAYDPEEDIHGALDWHLTKETDIKRKPTLVVNSSVAILQAVKKGIGIGPIPSSYEENQYEGLVRVLKNYQPTPFEFYYIIPIYLQNIKRFKLLGEYFESAFPA